MTHPDQFGVPSADISEIADDAVMVDVREPHEWAAGHAPNAILIPLGDLPHRLDELPDTDPAPVAITCRSGNRSGRAVAWLSQQGFDVANLDGGMKGWHAAGKPVVSASGQPQVI